MTDFKLCMTPSDCANPNPGCFKTESLYFPEVKDQTEYEKFMYNYW